MAPLFVLKLEKFHLNPHVIIGTPGRIIDHLQQRTLNLSDVSILVLDEADRMFDMGFAPQINKILQVVPKNRQTMLFSATMPDGIVKIASHHMKIPVRVEIARAGTTAENIEQELFVVKKDQKLSLLKKLLQEYKGSVLIFIRVKHGARKICMNLKDVGVSATEIHSNRSQNQRKEALDGFKTGKYRVLVATDIASRGIDVKNIELVINYDLPEQAEDYVHRIGRTGRAGMSGKAISFAMPDQGSLVREIEMLTRINLPISQLPADLPTHTADQFSTRTIFLKIEAEDQLLVMQKEDTKFDVAIIGGGPAGMMAAYRAAAMGCALFCWKKITTLGKKLLLTGGEDAIYQR